MLRKKSTPWGTEPKSDNSVEPVHVNPETDSNRASSNRTQGTTPVSKKGNAPANETATQLHATEANARAESAEGETLEPKNNPAPTEAVMIDDQKRPVEPPPPSTSATAAEMDIAKAIAINAAPVTRTGVTATRLIERPLRV